MSEKEIKLLVGIIKNLATIDRLSKEITRLSGKRQRIYYHKLYSFETLYKVHTELKHMSRMLTGSLTIIGKNCTITMYRK